MNNIVTFSCVAVAAGVVALYSPQYIENAPSPCGALSTKVMSYSKDKELQNPFVRAFSNGFLAPLVEGYITTAYPNLPSGVTCSYMYWNITFNPDAQRAAIALMNTASK